MRDPVTIHYTVEVEGMTREQSYTTEEVSDERAGWNPDVAESYAQHLAAETFGTEVDVNTVKVIRMGEPHDQFDETGSIGR